jgi:recombination protein RecR
VETYPSRLLENAVNELSRLPGIGKKTALRLCLHLLREDAITVENLGNSLIIFRQETRFCERCFNLSDEAICSICSSPQRSPEVICVVQDVRDVMAIENTRQYKGLYHVLNGIINPMEGIGPEDLTISGLLARVKDEAVKEVIFALPASIEGETTAYYLFKLLHIYSVKVSVIARGVAVGDDLEYADEVTLGRSILNRLPYEK